MAASVSRKRNQQLGRWPQPYTPFDTRFQIHQILGLVLLRCQVEFVRVLVAQFFPTTPLLLAPSKHVRSVVVDPRPARAAVGFTYH